MNRQINITEELKEMGSPLAGLSRTMPYHVPTDYFDDLDGELIKTIQNIESIEKVPDWSRSMPHSMPQGYFENLPAQILATVKSTSGVDEAKNQVPFTVPDRYFEHLPEKMLAAAKANSKTAVKIPLKRVIKPWQKNWAAAAVVFITIGLGGYIFFSNQPGYPERMLTNVSSTEIQEYLKHNSKMEVDHIVTSSEAPTLVFENKEIIEYLNESGWD